MIKKAMAEKETRESQASKDKGSDKKHPCEVTYFLDDQVLMGSSLHFHERGMLVVCEQPAPLNAKLKLILQFPGFKNPLELQGEVVWTNIYGPNDSLAPRGMGIKFLNLERDMERLLADMAALYEAFGSMYGCYYT